MQMHSNGELALNLSVTSSNKITVFDSYMKNNIIHKTRK